MSLMLCVVGLALSSLKDVRMLFLSIELSMSGALVFSQLLTLLFLSSPKQRQNVLFAVGTCSKQRAFHSPA